MLSNLTDSTPAGNPAPSDRRRWDAVRNDKRLSPSARRVASVVLRELRKRPAGILIASDNWLAHKQPRRRRMHPDTVTAARKVLAHAGHFDVKHGTCRGIASEWRLPPEKPAASPGAAARSKADLLAAVLEEFGSEPADRAEALSAARLSPAAFRAAGAATLQAFLARVEAEHRAAGNWCVNPSTGEGAPDEWLPPDVLARLWGGAQLAAIM